MTTSPVTRWIDHILGPDTEANRPAPADAPLRALFLNSDTGDMEYNTGSAWDVYVSATPAGELSDPTTTKGDLIVRGASSIGRHAVGADGTVVMADSSAGDGLTYQALNDSHVAPVAPNDQTGTTYTFVLADKHRLVTGNSGSAQTFTIPPNSSVAYPLGTSLQLYNKGAGLITFAAGAGVTIRTPRGAKIAVQYGLAQAIQVAADFWAISGDVTT